MSGELRRRDGEDQVCGKALGRRRGAGWQGGAEGGNTRCVEAPKWRKEKVEKNDFSWVCLLKGLWTSSETTRQQSESKQVGGHFPPTPAGCSAIQLFSKKGCRNSWMKNLSRAISYKGTVDSHGSGNL